MICSAVWLVRFMVEYPAQTGRLRTLIHPGPSSGGHVSHGARFRKAFPRFADWQGLQT